MFCTSSITGPSYGFFLFAQKVISVEFKSKVGFGKVCMTKKFTSSTNKQVLLEKNFLRNCDSFVNQRFRTCPF